MLEKILEEFPAKHVSPRITTGTAGKCEICQISQNFQHTRSEAAAAAWKVATHNKELYESTLTSQRLSCPAPTGTRFLLCAPFFCRKVASWFGSISRAKQLRLTEKGGMQSMSLVWNQRAEENARRQRRGVETHTRKSFVGPKANSSPDIRLLVG